MLVGMQMNKQQKVYSMSRNNNFGNGKILMKRNPIFF